MKKLSLNASAFQKGEILTRAQLKKVLGGSGSGGGSGETACATTCKCPAGYTVKPGKNPGIAISPCAGNCTATENVSITCNQNTLTCADSTVVSEYCLKNIV